MRLFIQGNDFVEVQNPMTKAQLLQFNWRSRGIANWQLDSRAINNNSNSNRYRSVYANRGSENHLVRNDRGTLRNLKQIRGRREGDDRPQDYRNPPIVIEALRQWCFHVVEEMQCRCVLSVDFVKAMKISLYFDQKMLMILELEIKMVLRVDEQIEVDLSHTNLDESQKRQLHLLFRSSGRLVLDDVGVQPMFDITRFIRVKFISGVDAL
ncbi:hypothetical protein TNCV_446941 [Trichonephila clavipes]|nr:hypothetical protein TNCV_446941 [Trichonephila clavipes]